VNLEEEFSNTHGGLGILEIPSSIVNTFILSILSSCFELINSTFIISTVTSGIKAVRFHFFFLSQNFQFYKMMGLLGYKRVQQRRSWQQQWEQQDSRERELDSFKNWGERFDQLWRKTDEAINQLMSSMEKFRRALEQRDKSVSFDTMEANSTMRIQIHPS
jgi:hypothetical protein